MMSIRQVLTTMLLALAIGALLNADALESAASTKEFGPARDRALAVWGPVQRLSGKVALNRPRQMIESAIGRGEDADTDVVDDVEPVVAGTSEQSTRTAPALGPSLLGPAEPSVSPSTTTSTIPGPKFPIVATPAPGSPIRILAAGDSMVETFGTSLTRIASETELFDTRLEFRVESGLFRPDFFNWPVFLGEQMATFDPDVAVIMFGANDAQAYEENGEIFEPFSPTWMNHYQPQVAQAMDALVAEDRLVIWVTMPVTVLGDDFNERMTKLNAIYREEAAKRDGVIIVESWPLFSGPDGGYVSDLPAVDGTRRGLRQRDGLHFSTVGGDRLSWSVLEVANHFVDLSASAKGPDPDTIAPRELRLSAYTPSGLEPRPDSMFPRTPPG